MADSAAVSPLGAESRRRLTRLRLTTAGFALLLLVPFVLLTVAAVQSAPIHPFLLAAALGLGAPPLLALSHLRHGPAPIGLRLAAAFAFTLLLAAGAVVVLFIGSFPAGVYPANAPTFLDPSIASLTPRAGYVREFVAGPSPKRLDPRQSSPTSVTGYSYGARPKQYARGYQSFFADETGVIRSTREDRPATAKDPPIE